MTCRQCGVISAVVSDVMFEQHTGKKADLQALCSPLMSHQSAVQLTECGSGDPSMSTLSADAQTASN